MRNFIFTAMFLAGIIFTARAQTVSGIIHGLSEDRIYLADFYGDQHKIIDSTETNLAGVFILSLEGRETGFYRIIYGRQRFIDFIFNQEAVSFTTNAENPFENITFSSSVENLIWYDYLFRKKESQFKLDLLNPLLVYYPESSAFYAQVREEYKAVQDDFESYVQSILDLNSQTFAAKAIRIDKPFLIDTDLPMENQNDYIKAHYFDGITLDDPTMLHSNVISSKIIGYLSLYRDPAFSKELQEESFIQAIDTILLKTMDNEEIYNFTLQYLIDGFELYGFDRVITHIAEHYQPAEACIHDGDNSELIKRMENIKNLAVGKKAPDINITAVDGRPFRLSTMESDYALVVFWASWCTHCQALMPDLKQVYADRETYSLEIIAIAVDTSRSAFEKYIHEEQFTWIDYFSPSGWNSKPAMDYSVFATPTMLLVDKNRKIIAKPMDARELKKTLEELP